MGRHLVQWALGVVLVLLLVLSVSLPNQGNADPNAIRDAGEQCSAPGDPITPSYEYFNVDTGAVANAVATSGTVSVPFSGGSRTLQLYPYSIGAPGAKILIDDGSSVQEVDPPFTIGIGFQAGIPDSLAVVTVHQAFFDAMLYVPSTDEWFFDSNVPGASVGGSIHRGWAVVNDPLPAGEYQSGPPSRCQDDPEGGGDGPQSPGGGGPSGPAPSPPRTRGAARPEPLHNLIAQNFLASGDVEYTDVFWWCPIYRGIPAATCAATQMAAEVARLNVIYNGLETRGVRTPMVSFTVVAFDVHVRPGTGGMTSFDCLTLGGQYRAHAVAAHDANLNYHVGHLFSGKELNGNCIGAGGYGGEMPDFQAHWSVAQQVSAGLSTYQATEYARMLVNSHEVGHTYTADHQPLAVRIRVCIVFICYDFYSIMWNPYQGDSWMLPRFSDSVTDNRAPQDANRDRIHTNAHGKVQR